VKPSARPAETGGIGVAIAVLVAHLLGVTDATVITALAVVAGAIPAAITFVVATFRKPKSTTKAAKR
jgi:hypothetical protein